MIDLDENGKVINSGFPELDGLTVDEGLAKIRKRVEEIEASRNL